MSNQERPFDMYPDGGRKLRNKKQGYDTRHVDGPEFMRITGTTKCAYCGLDFTACFKNWLSMVLDHAVPISVCNDIEIIDVKMSDWVSDYTNLILACSACNGYCNQYKPPWKCSGLMSLTEFYDQRDKIFDDRKKCILEKRNAEKSFFDLKPWVIEIILEIGCEGGSLSIVRQRNQNGNWEYWYQRDETTLREVLPKDEIGNKDDLLGKSKRVSKLKDALSLLDKYPWYSFVPLKVLADYDDLILSEVEKRGGKDAAIEWSSRLKRHN